MPHMVIFRNAEGKNGYHPTESLDDAVRFVEHLRNAEQVTDARVFRMQEVKIEFKVLYKVEVEDEPGSSSGSDSSSSSSTAAASTPPAVAAEAPSSAAPPPPAPTPEAAPPAPEPEPARAAASSDGGGQSDETGGRFGLFSRS